jgi:signal peptidase I
LAIIIPIRYFLFQPFFVRGASMEPNFEDGEYLIVNEISYRFHEPGRGDVVIFRYPKDPSQYYIKRVIGLPNEVVRIEEGRVMIVNSENPKGFVLDEPYLSEGNKYTFGNLEMNLDENDYFVLGDNRSASSDSRSWGPVPRHYIIGWAWVRAWPFNRVGILD